MISAFFHGADVVRVAGVVKIVDVVKAVEQNRKTVDICQSYEIHF